jgi:hypothetical protein
MKFTPPNYQYYEIQFFEDLETLVVQHLTISINILQENIKRPSSRKCRYSTLLWNAQVLEKTEDTWQDDRQTHKYNLYKDIRQKET